MRRSKRFPAEWKNVENEAKPPSQACLRRGLCQGNIENYGIGVSRKFCDIHVLQFFEICRNSVGIMPFSAPKFFRGPFAPSCAALF